MVTVATERPTGCQSPAPALSQVNRHFLVNPARCQLQMAPMTPFDRINLSATNGPMTPFDTINWPSLTKGNRLMSRPQKSIPGVKKDSKVPS